MINLQLTVREAFELSTNCSRDIYEKIILAFEVAIKPNQSKNCTVNITNMTTDNRISCIEVIRNATGWDLKTTKEWTDVIVGSWIGDKFFPAAPDKKNSITLNTPEQAENLLRELVDKGCEGYLS